MLGAVAGLGRRKAAGIIMLAEKEILNLTRLAPASSRSLRIRTCGFTKLGLAQKPTTIDRVLRASI